MKRNKITDQIGSFKNRDQKGLFTFYLQTQQPENHSPLHQPNLQVSNTIDREPNPLIDSKRITPRKKIQPRKRPIKTLTEQLNQADSISLLTKNHQNPKLLTQPSTSSELQKIKELFNFKRKSNQKLIEQSIQCNKKISSSKSFKLERKASNMNQSKNGPRHSSIGTHMVYPLEVVKEREFFPSRSPKRHQSLERDFHDNQNFLLPDLHPQTQMNLENTIHQLKCQVIIHPEKFKSIVFPSGKKKRYTYVRDHLLINNDPLREGKISIELKPKYGTPELEKLIRSDDILDDSNQTLKKIQDLQSTPLGIPRFSPTRKHHLFNTLERSLMSSLQKVDQEEFENDLKQIYKERGSPKASNLLRKRSQLANRNANISEFRIKRSVNGLQQLQKAELIYDIRKNESQIINLKGSKVKNGKMLSVLTRKDQPRDKSVKQIKHNFLQILTKIKDRYQSI